MASTNFASIYSFALDSDGEDTPLPLQ